MPRPQVITRCVADHYADKRNARIVEVSDRTTGLGCLISVTRTEHDGLRIDVYRRDKGVKVRAAHAGN